MNYVVTSTTPVWRLNDNGHWQINGRKFLGDKIPDLTIETVVIHGVTCRLFASGVDAIDDSCIKPVDGASISHDAVVSDWSEWAYGQWGECIDSVQARTIKRTRYVITPAIGNGTTPPLFEEAIDKRSCDGEENIAHTRVATILESDSVPINDRPDYNDAKRIREARAGETFVVDATPIVSDQTVWHRIAVGPERGCWLYFSEKPRVRLT